ncbi:MAG: thiopurine S-methyltransferase, partial [Pseudomonadota bacterium]
RWETGRIGFHQAKGNPLFIAHFPALVPAPGARLFLPLAGKTGDIHWLLDQGYRVVTAELNQLAVDQLFEELGATPEVIEGPASRLYSAPGLDAHVGDVFDLTPDALGPVDLVYDRAALVALPEAMRRDYAPHIARLSKGVPQILVTFEYDQCLGDGPPFAVSADEVADLYAEAYVVELIERKAVPDGLPALPNVTQMTEALWHLTPLNRETS